mmetsp:Transcript_22853/g.68018  ORF Transcript_22853/g.68018 Transcript_22853/m.68018 type:complete len:200 (-) Transcript_22853:15-614(-)
MGSMSRCAQSGMSIFRKTSSAFNRKSNIQSGSPLISQICLTMSAFSPFGNCSDSTSVTKPAAYSCLSTASSSSFWPSRMATASCTSACAAAPPPPLAARATAGLALPRTRTRRCLLLRLATRAPVATAAAAAAPCGAPRPAAAVLCLGGVLRERADWAGAWGAPRPGSAKAVGSREPPIVVTTIDVAVAAQACFSISHG